MKHSFKLGLLSLFSFYQYCLPLQSYEDLEKTHQIIFSPECDSFINTMCTELIACNEQLKTLITGCLGNFYGQESLKPLMHQPTEKFYTEASEQLDYADRITRSLNSFSKIIRYNESSLIPEKWSYPFSNVDRDNVIYWVNESLQNIKAELSAFQDFFDTSIKRSPLVPVDNDLALTIKDYGTRFRSIYASEELEVPGFLSHMLENSEDFNPSAIFKVMALEFVDLIRDNTEDNFTKSIKEFSEYYRSSINVYEETFHDAFVEEINKSDTPSQLDMLCKNYGIDQSVFENEAEFDLQATLPESHFYDNNCAMQSSIIGLYLALIEEKWLDRVLEEERTALGKILERRFNHLPTISLITSFSKASTK